MPVSDDFKTIYKILTALERGMDCPDFNIIELNETSLKISKERLYRILEMLQDAGLIKNADLRVDATGEMFIRNEKKIRITLNGLEYLQENSIMRKIYNAARGVTELVP